jgi:hypothetical protein
VLAALCAWLPATAARADWIVSPFVGLKFGGDTNIVDLESGVGQRKFTLGGAVGLLTDDILGLEFDIGYTSRFFEGGDPGILVVRSSVTTLMGNAIAAVPVRLTGRWLRPYIGGGLGLITAHIDDVQKIFPVNSNLFGANLGGGVFGPLSDTTSLRFDLRFFKNLSGEDEPIVRGATTRLSFWRATIGVSLRY